MSYHFNPKKLISDLRGPKGFGALIEEAGKISQEISSLSKSTKIEAEARLKKTQVQIKVLQGRVAKAQKELDSELKKTYILLKKRTSETEKKLKAALKGTQKSKARSSKKTK